MEAGLQRLADRCRELETERKAQEQVCKDLTVSFREEVTQHTHKHTGVFFSYLYVHATRKGDSKKQRVTLLVAKEPKQNKNVRTV